MESAQPKTDTLWSKLKDPNNRILIGFITLVSALLIIGALGWGTLTTLFKTMDKYNSASQLESLLDDARINELIFTRDLDLNAANRATEAIEQSIELLYAKGNNSIASQEIIASLDERLKTFQQGFSQYTNLRLNSEQMHRHMVRAARKVTSSTTALQNLQTKYIRHDKSEVQRLRILMEEASKTVHIAYELLILSQGLKNSDIVYLISDQNLDEHLLHNQKSEILQQFEALKKLSPSALNLSIIEKMQIITEIHFDMLMVLIEKRKSTPITTHDFNALEKNLIALERNAIELRYNKVFQFSQYQQQINEIQNTLSARLELSQEVDNLTTLISNSRQLDRDFLMARTAETQRVLSNQVKGLLDDALYLGQRIKKLLIEEDEALIFKGVVADIRTYKSNFAKMVDVREQATNVGQEMIYNILATDRSLGKVRTARTILMNETRASSQYLVVSGLAFIGSLFLLVYLVRRSQLALVTLNDQLIEARDKAQLADQSKSDFLANMSHEIRTPMNAIIGMSYLAIESNELKPKQKSHIQIVHRSAKALLGIINDILDFSKIEAGKLEVEQIEFRVQSLFDDFSNIIGLKAKEGGLELNIDIDSNFPEYVISDPLRLGQILLNLGSNAVKFTKKGQVELTASVKEQTPTGLVLEFSIRDTGIGMTQDQQNNLFNSFQQADTSITRQYGGTGLGLAISKQLSELMGGGISVESARNVGSTFTFWVSVKSSEKAVDLALATTQNFENKRVLIVDDSDSARRISKKQLEKLGINSDSSNSVDEAHSVLTTSIATGNQYDAILLDWKMPEESGTKLVQRLYQENSPDQIPPIVMITAYEKDDVKAEIAQFDLSVEAVLSKPISSRQLLSTFSNIWTANAHIDTPEELQQRVHQQNLDSLSGSHVLLVEDNEMNQTLACELLSSANIRYAIANNGQEAIDLLKVETFDGVLMDCQMPVLDGYQATHKIRSDLELVKLPIIAMTANNMAGDRVKAIDSGMNDFISKPIDIHEMFATMQKWIVPSHSIERHIDPHQHSETHCVEHEPLESDQSNQDSSPKELTLIDWKNGLKRCNDQIELYHTLLKQFVENYTPDDIADQISTHPIGEHYLHTLKGVVGNIGAPSLHQLCTRLENALETDDSIKANGLKAELISEFSDTHTELINYLSKIQCNDNSPVHMAPVSKLVSDRVKLDLIKVLEDADAEAIDLVNGINHHNQIGLDEATFTRIKKSINNFDFDAALGELEKHEQKNKP
ncbi:response regulator [uncultured Vibrio sp.]|uniref:response regulator n=1 Tax=uncultured Vibrio sp. TaxID=114054 RepID=UPI00260152BA|nr:response regulator [uncultured Vibrio sp.]